MGWFIGREMHHGRGHYSKIGSQGDVSEDLFGRHLRWADSAMKLRGHAMGTLEGHAMVTLEGHARVPVGWRAPMGTAIIARHVAQ